MGVRHYITDLYGQSDHPFLSKTRSLIENGFVETIKAVFPEVEVIAGTATAGIPHGAIVADKMDLPLPISAASQRIMEQATK